MRSYFFSPEGRYYEGDRAHALDAEVPQRPDADHRWNGVAWEPDAAKIKAREVEAAKVRLAEIDLASVRAIREYIAARTDAPQLLKDLEAATVAERKKLL